MPTFLLYKGGSKVGELVAALRAFRNVSVCPGKAGSKKKNLDV